MASDQTTELISALDQITTILRSSNESHWATWLERDRKLIANGDFYGVEHLLQAFGGMGSFNDYAPVTVAQGGSVSVIRGMERLDQIAGQVHENALALMVVEGDHAL